MCADMAWEQGTVWPLRDSLVIPQQAKLRTSVRHRNFSPVDTAPKTI